MHSDQTRKDGSSESMIQALYYDFVANYQSMSRPGCTVRVMCSVTVEVRAVLTEELLRVAVQKYCPARNLAIALSVRKLDTSCPLVVAGGGWGRSYTRPLPLEVKKYVVVLFSFWPDVQYKCNSGDTIPCEGA